MSGVQWAKRVAALAALLPTLGLVGCLTVTWQRTRAFEPVTDAQLAALRADDAGLERVLASLGAPLDVREYQRTGMVLSYGWSTSESWGARVSVPLADTVSASFNYDQIDASAPGVVLFLDGDLRLVRWRRGLLRDLARELERPVPGPPLRPDEDRGDGAELTPGSTSP